MNIWYLSAHDQPRGRSARTYDFSLELLKRGHKVTFFTNSYDHWTHTDILKDDEKWRVDTIDGIRVIWMRTTPYAGNGLKRGVNMLSNAFRALQVERTLKDQPDAVIGPSVPLGTGWAALKIAKKRKAAFVFEVRDVWPIALVDDGAMKKTSPVYLGFRALEKTLYRQAHRISSTVPFLFDHVAQSGSDPKKVTWIPNGVAMDRFAGFGGYTGGTKLPLTVMYVGGYGNAHDVITLVRAAQLLKKRGDDRFRFILIGDGVKRAECEKEAAGLTNIEFRNSVPKADVPKVQQESDILVACVLDSPIYRFGLNLNKIFDYFASERPVVFSGKAPNDPIKDSGAGFSVPPENPEAMAEALLKIGAMSPEQRVAMGKRGYNYIVNEFNMPILASRMETLLTEAVQRKRSS